MIATSKVIPVMWFYSTPSRHHNKLAIAKTLHSMRIVQNKNVVKVLKYPSYHVRLSTFYRVSQSHGFVVKERHLWHNHFKVESKYSPNMLFTVIINCNFSNPVLLNDVYPV